MKYFFYVFTAQGTKTVSASTLREIVRLKHNYKTSPHFRKCEVSAIYETVLDRFGVY